MPLKSVHMVTQNVIIFPPPSPTAPISIHLLGKWNSDVLVSCKLLLAEERGRFPDIETHKIKKPRAVRPRSRHRVCLTYPQGCISKISKLILLWRLQPSIQCSWLEKKNCIILFFKSLPLLALVSPPSLSAGNFISYFCTPSFYLQICLVQLLRSLTHQCHLEEAIYRWAGGVFSITFWTKGSKHLSARDAGTGSTLGVSTAQELGRWSRKEKWVEGSIGTRNVRETPMAVRKRKVETPLRAQAVG